MRPIALCVALAAVSACGAATLARSPSSPDVAPSTTTIGIASASATSAPSASAAPAPPPDAAAFEQAKKLDGMRSLDALAQFRTQFAASPFVREALDEEYRRALALVQTSPLVDVVALSHRYGDSDKDAWRQAFVARLFASPSDPWFALACDDFLLRYPTRPRRLAYVGPQRSTGKPRTRRRRKSGETRCPETIKPTARRRPSPARSPHATVPWSATSGASTAGRAPASRARNSNRGACYRRVVGPCCAACGSRLAPDGETCLAHDDAIQRAGE